MTLVYDKSNMKFKIYVQLFMIFVRPTKALTYNTITFTSIIYVLTLHWSR